MISFSMFNLQCDADVVDIVFEGLLPLVSASVHEIQTATGILEAYA